MAGITLEDMLQAGVHFGHRTKYWNPKMEPYIFGVRNKTHIINLEQSVQLFKPALAFVKSVAQKNNKILFVGNKKEALLFKRNSTKIINNQEYSRCIQRDLDKAEIERNILNELLANNSEKSIANLLSCPNELEKAFEACLGNGLKATLTDGPIHWKKIKQSNTPPLPDKIKLDKPYR